MTDLPRHPDDLSSDITTKADQYRSESETKPPPPFYREMNGLGASP